LSYWFQTRWFLCEFPIGSYVKEVKNCRLSIRHFRHVKKRAKAKKALTRLRTIANKLIRELQRKLPTHSLFETYQKDFLFYQQVLAQQPKDKNKIYSLHEPDMKTSKNIANKDLCKHLTNLCSSVQSAVLCNY
jgi:hypothetical protein